MKHAGKWIGRTVIFTGVAAFLLGIAFLIYSVSSRTITNDYTARLQISLNAAMLSNGIHVKGDDGAYHELGEDSYKKLGFYLTQKPVLAIFGGSGDALELRIGDDTLRVVPKGTEGIRAVVYFETMGKSYRVEVKDNRLWDGLNACTGEEAYLAPEPDADK